VRHGEIGGSCVRRLAGQASLSILSETAGYWHQRKSALTTRKVIATIVHDARIAALCSAHGVRELCSAERDFGRFCAALSVRNPLVD
jgi:hypothetical protein